METYAQQTPAGSDCCVAAPPVLEFDEDGNLIGHWGGPGTGYDWPLSMHGITVDYKGNVWIGGNGRGAPSGAPPPPPAEEGQVPIGPYHDCMILKFTQDGKFLMQIGKPWASKGSNDVENHRGPAKMWVDPKTNELYVADGSIWDIAFSKDPGQKYIYASDGTNEKIHILDRATMEVLTSFGDGGRQPGEFYAVHSIATDSKGNIFTTETYRGQRVQKFIYKGIGPVKQDQGVLWPSKH